MKLYQLPDGAWIDPNKVDAIRAHDGHPAFASAPATQPRVIVELKGGGYCVCKCDSLMLAQDLRDELAIAINDRREDAKS